MTKFYDGCTRGGEKEGGGHYWDQAGYTLITKPRDDGRIGIYLKDHRNPDVLITFFERRKRDEGDAPAPSRPAPQTPPKQASGDFEDDIPF